MKTFILKYWEQLRSSFWFVPAIMAAGAVVLAFVAVGVDRSLSLEWLRALGWAYTGGAEGASAVLETIAGSMITIAGVVFSLTLVALSLASSQFGPRLLRNFMRDTANQFVLGAFIATFLYCLLVLRTIRRADEFAFVPHLSVTLGVVFALFSIAVLIYFIHHVSVSIQADKIVSQVGAELVDGIERLFPTNLGEDQGETKTHPIDAQLPENFERDAQPLQSARDGYVQLIDLNALMSLAAKQNVVFRIERRPGQYVVAGSPLVRIWPANLANEELEEEVKSAFVIGNQRTISQDIEFGVNQLVEIASRALSPGVNDPFTAMTCIDRLGSALCRLAKRDAPSDFRFDEEGNLRIVAPPFSFEQILKSAFDPIRHYGKTSPLVVNRLLETLTVIGTFSRSEKNLNMLQRQADMVITGARTNFSEAHDREATEKLYLAFCSKIKKC